MDIVKPRAVLIDWEGTISRGKSIYPHMRELLELLQKHKIYTAVVSNMRADPLRDHIVEYGMFDYFDKVVGYGDCSEGKPNTAPAFKALEDSGIAPSLDVFFIGDSPADIICALNSGCRSLFLNTDNYPEHMLRNTPAHHIFKSHAELLKFMDKALK